MDIKYLNEFRVLAEILNYQEAAEQLYISLSSLSKHISKMEAELGVTLFDRTKRSVQLNEYGTLLYEYACRIVKTYDECTSALNELHLDDTCRLSVGFLPVLTQYGMIESLSSFMRQHPNIQVSMTETHHPRELLESRKCDVIFDAGYGGYKTDSPYLSCKVDSLVVVLPKDHPLAGQENVTIAQLRNEKFIMKHDLSPLLSQIIGKLCMEAGFEPQITHTVTYASAIVKLVSEHNGIAIMNRYHIPNKEKYEVEVLDIQPSIPFNIYMLYSGERKNSLGLKSFRRYYSSKPNWH